MHAKFDHNTGIYYAIYEKMYLDKDFQGNIVLTLTFDIETLFKVTASFIYKYIFYVECDIIKYVKDVYLHLPSTRYCSLYFLQKLIFNLSLYRNSQTEIY